MVGSVDAQSISPSTAWTNVPISAKCATKASVSARRSLSRAITNPAQKGSATDRQPRQVGRRCILRRQIHRVLRGTRSHHDLRDAATQSAASSNSDQSRIWAQSIVKDVLLTPVTSTGEASASAVSSSSASTGCTSEAHLRCESRKARGGKRGCGRASRSTSEQSEFRASWMRSRGVGSRVGWCGVELRRKTQRRRERGEPSANCNTSTHKTRNWR